MGIKVKIWGDYALFSRPEMKVERCTYDVITASAARGILDAIYWHPGFKWLIDKIYIQKPIRFTSIRRNEVNSKILESSVKRVLNGSKEKLYLSTKDDIAQRTSIILKDVEYVIEAHFEMTPSANESDNPAKFIDIMKRRIKKGQCFHTPYFGCREFPVRFAPCDDEKIFTAYEDEEERDLGYVLYDMDYSDPKDIKPIFFRAIMRRGTLDIKEAREAIKKGILNPSELKGGIR